jgi:hypothetical protein
MEFISFLPEGEVSLNWTHLYGAASVSAARTMETLPPEEERSWERHLYTVVCKLGFAGSVSLTHFSRIMPLVSRPISSISAGSDRDAIHGGLERRPRSIVPTLPSNKIFFCPTVILSSNAARGAHASSCVRQWIGAARSGNAAMEMERCFFRGTAPDLNMHHPLLQSIFPSYCSTCHYSDLDQINLRCLRVGMRQVNEHAFGVALALALVS